MPNDSISEFLNRIAKIESSDNYAAKHRTMQGGLHRGMSAVGRYGLMPLTIAELLQRKRNDDDQAVRDMPDEPEAGFVGPVTEPSVVQMEPGEEDVAGLNRFMDPDARPGSSSYREGAQIAASNLAEMPEAQDYLARQMAKRLLDKTGGDQDRAAYMWTMGHNQRPQGITPEKLDTSDYVRKFRSLASKDSDVPQLEEMSVRPKKKQFQVLSKRVAQR